MKLIHADLSRYRSIDGPTGFDIEPDITCLVGKNESGKTATLQALYKSVPVGNSPFDEGLDYPSHKARELRGDKPIEVSALTYRLSEDDIAAVEALLGPHALASTEVTVSTGYRFKARKWNVSLDEQAITDNLRDEIELPPTEMKAAEAATTVQELMDVLEGMEATTPGSDAAIIKIKEWRDSNPELAAIDALAKRLPVFVYFGDYDVMPGIVSIPRLIENRDKDSLSKGEEALLALLSLAGVKLEDLNTPQSNELLIRQMENASNAISDEVFEYWSQNNNLQVELTILPRAETGASLALNQGPLLQVRVRNSRHRVTVPFDERSRGFVWFFSFLAYFSKLELEAEQPLILLLDEPGLSLHATAQHDLLRFISERLAPHHQVLFSTHSPFMIDARHLNQVRTVVDDENRGTIVSEDVLQTDKESVFPLHAALGIELTQTLFVGPHVLFVEGPSDVIYLQYFSSQLMLNGRSGLDERWTIVPGGGITKLPAFLTLFGANSMEVTVLTDSSPDNTKTVTDLRKAERLYAGGMIQVGDILRQEEADIEDFFTPKFYVDLVNDAYQGSLKGSPISVEELPDGSRIVKRIESLFKRKGINNGHLNHFSPASALLRQKTPPKLTKRVLDHAEILIDRINACLN